jgi:hypothetical protein
MVIKKLDVYAAPATSILTRATSTISSNGIGAGPP